MKTKTFLSPKSGFYDVDLGVLGTCAWSAKYWMNGPQVIIEQATAINPFSGNDIDITDFAKQDYDCKNWIALEHQREREKELEPDENAAFDQWNEKEPA